jgi:iron complex outermembrane receptor protein
MCASIPTASTPVPRASASLSADYEVGRWNITGRVRHFGKWVYVASTTPANPVYETIGAESFVDLVAGYALNPRINVTVGVENLLDNYIQHARLVTVRNNGRLYPGGAPYENEGRQVYTRIGIRF